MDDRKRRFARKSLQAQLRGRDARGEGILIFEATDLSAGGTFLRSDLLLEEGTMLALELHVPGMERPLAAQARVAWVRRFPKEGLRAGMGVEFLAMSDEDRRSLHELLR